MTTDLQLGVRRVLSRNPATSEVLRAFECATEGNIGEAVARARKAQAGWSQLGIQKRLVVLRTFQHILQQKKSDVARLITREAGKPYAEALATEILVVLDAVRFLVEQSYQHLREEPVPHGNLAMKTKRGRILREPYGVIGIISPWNYPFSIPATESAAALAAGNSVVLKPSEWTTLVALELAALLREAGLPEDVFQVLPGDGLTGATLAKAFIDKLIFTGSVPTGRRIAETAGARLLPVVLELGGKDPMIVLEDADIDVASSGAVWGAFVNAGQACLSVERCYVQRRLYAPFLEACVRKTQRLRVGDGLTPGTDIGPLIHERQVRLVEEHVQDAVTHGARILSGGHRLPELGANFYAPTLLADVTHEMRIMREETFGPVLPVMAFDEEEQAIDWANDSAYGLGASIWTRDSQHGEQLARCLQAGAVMVNDAVSCFGIAEAPHGGVKASGLGRTHGKFGLEEMVRVKYVDSDRLPGIKRVWWYGYGAAFAKQMEGFLDMQFAGSLSARVKGAVRSLGILTREGRL